MTNEKRGSEKLLDDNSDMCSLTADEIAQVGGMGPQPTRIFWPDLYPPIKFPDSFPLGNPGPPIYERPIFQDDFRDLVGSPTSR